MRAVLLGLAAIAMSVGLAIFGFVNKTLGVVLLFGGVALWVVADKKTLLLIERAVASRTIRQTLDEHAARKRQVQDQFHNLSPVEQEAVRYVRQNGHILPGQVASYLASRGFADSEGVIDSVRGKTPFLLGSFSGEYSINRELKESLDELLDPPLLSPPARTAILLTIVALMACVGYAFCRYAYPVETTDTLRHRLSASGTAAQAQTSPRPGPTDALKVEDSVSTEVRRAERPIEFSFPSTGERKQKFHVHNARPTLIQIEPRPTGVKEDDLPAEVPVDGGSITVLKFGQEDDGGYVIFDTSRLPKGTRIRVEVIGYAEIGAKKSGAKTSIAHKPPTTTTPGTSSPFIGSVAQGPGSAFSVNQSGGITAGTINNYLPSQRILTPEQQKILVATLNNVCPFDIAVRGVPGNAESLEYAAQITAAIEQAGCKPRRAKFLIDTSAGYGVWVALHDTSAVPPGADALVDAFTKAGIKTQGETLEPIEPGVVYVMVEFNDSKPPS